MISYAGYAPSKETAIAVALAARLTLDEARGLLHIAGYALSESLPADIVYAACFRRHVLRTRLRRNAKQTRERQNTKDIYVVFLDCGNFYSESGADDGFVAHWQKTASVADRRFVSPTPNAENRRFPETARSEVAVVGSWD